MQTDEDLDERLDRYWREHEHDVATSPNPKYIDEFIQRKARVSAEWATAYAILEAAKYIRGGLEMVSGVDDFTGIMRIGAYLEAFYDLAKKTLKEKEPSDA